MNPRIFKKLTKKAAYFIERLDAFESLTKIVVGADDVESTEQSRYWVHKKYRDKFGNFTQLDGTVGFGCVSGYYEPGGYYEPEWSDTDALSMLYDWYIHQHVDYDAFPEYVTSLSKKEYTWKHAFAYAKAQIKAQQRQRLRVLNDVFKEK